MSPLAGTIVSRTSAPYERLNGGEGFIDEDREIHDKLFNPDAYPHIYRDDRWEFEEGSHIIPTNHIIHDEKEVVFNGQTLYQPTRHTKNKGFDRIKTSIEEQGYQLSLPLPIVRRIRRKGLPDSYALVEGRNRKTII